MSKKKLEEQNKLEERVSELENQLKRAVADYQNLEKRVQEGRSELTNFMGAELIKRLLPVLDHLEKVVDGSRSILSEQSESKDWFRGVEMAIKEFKQVLESEGLEEIPADGEFNPALHEAVDTRDGQNNMILEIVKKGYNLNGKVIRPAQVVVGRKSESSNMNQELREEI
ncbi:nucleotide exchange factor GrpE [Candidatus Daviesbacteria bacterium]|nr:nucleotide exchange factor GrpE [Candidatus Daviesbacteria bacterium]